MRVALMLVVVLGCGSDHHATGDAGVHDVGNTPDAPPDAPTCIPFAPPTCGANVAPTAPATGAATCNVLTQTGCNAGEKCTSIKDSATLSHIGCAPDGTVVAECACSYGAVGTTGYDNCTKGNVCISGTCKQICDQNGGTPMCGTRYACSLYGGVFDVGGTPAAGACDRRCDPLLENDFLANGHKEACACTGSAQGCYGFPRSTGTPTAFTCTKEINPTLVHRSACTTANGCMNGGSVFLNGCAQGYLPLLDEMTGSTQVDCIAMCSPGNAYMGNTGTQHPAGLAPHACSTDDARGTFTSATDTVNGDHCAYSWIFEFDSGGNFVKSQTSNTVGFCIDHSKYRYDSNNDGQVNGSDAVWPLCTSLGIGSNVNNGFDAAFFGCVDSASAGMPTRVPRLDLRVPFRRTAGE